MSVSLREENKMAVRPVFPLLMSMAIPPMISMLIQSLYNIVDSYFVAQVSQNALTAVSLAFPIQNLLVAFGVGTGVGVSSLISRRLGERDQEAADNAATHGIILSAITYVVFAIFGAIVARPFTALYTQDAEVLSMGTTYITIVTVASFGFFFAAVIEKMLQATGNMVMPMVIQLVGAVANIIFDPILIFNFNMGVAGAAIATVVSQLGSGVLCVWYMRKHFEVLRMEKDDWRLRKTEVLRLLGMGVPVGLQFSITAIGSVMLQSAVNSLGAVCVSGVAVASKIYMLLCCPFDALAMAATNFTGQNLGAGKYDRIRQGTYACLLLGIIYCAIYIVIARFGTQYLVLLFMNADEAQSVLDYTQRISYAYAYGTPLLLGVNVFRLSIQGMGYSRLSLISGLLEMIARTAVGIWGVPQFGFAAACLASPLAWALADCFLIPAYYGCLNARRRQAARVRKELPTE